MRTSILALLVVLGASATAADDMERANSYDDAWQGEWIGHCRKVFTKTGKTEGLTLAVGDSITHANPSTAWPRNGAGKTPSDSTILAWCHWDVSYASSMIDPNFINGLELASADVSNWRG